jgi:hypothetical protein
MSVGLSTISSNKIHLKHLERFIFSENDNLKYDKSNVNDFYPSEKSN